MKKDHKPILSAGIHDFNLQKFEKKFVKPFSSSTRRQLFKRFKVFCQEFETAGIPFELWADGSFVTNKADPADMDLVIFCKQSDVERLDDFKRKSLQNLVDNSIAKARYQCDVYFAIWEDKSQRDYWRKWYGNGRDGRPKGIARLSKVEQ